ncbi:hypothetical protein EGS93_18710 [Salmonella enterica]|nr:hypothetical protein [Salmonella enterica]ECG1409661.1 hypothetical protein [Salmonella enterica subsp. enterica serovar Derby str. CFSAN000566]EDE2918564.1 hypothetical protein [Salmonella enterica subsp. enterica serovar Typhimurium]HAE4578365.1 hypothetical protein [Salmonella enterica subsp. enterica serovar Derby]HAU7715775.1 hypothetical protein [Salmonella enterica subsp. enterica]
MKRVMMGVMALALVGCAPKPPEDRKSGSFIYIYSTTSKAIAQDRADKLCGGHAFYTSNGHLFASKYGPRYPAIEFNCDLDMAAYQGSQEAKDIKMKRIEEAYKEMYKAQYELKEVRRKNADPKKLESYTERDPDGTIRSYSFLDGKSCESIVYPDGTGKTTCD